MSDLFLTPAPRDDALPRPVRIGVVGSGFRARTMLRVAAALPGWFDVAGVTARSSADRDLLASHGFAAHPGLDGLLAGSAQRPAPDLVVVTLPADAAQDVVRELAAAGVPALLETPAAGTVPELVELQGLVESGACVHVAEQYHLEPLVSAQLEVAASGRLGAVTDAHVNLAHDYHGLSVLRRALGVTFEEPLVTARRDVRQVLPSPSRYADPVSVDPVASVHALAWLDYGDRLGVYEFDDVQYRSWVRSPSLVVRGPYGELRDDVVRSVRASDDGAPQPLVSRLERVAAGGAGNHEGLFLRGYTLDGGWVWRNRFRPARLADEELAVAELFARAGEHVLAGAPSPYEVAEAAQDQYLQLVAREAAAAAVPVRAVRQPWADGTGCRHAARPTA
ncbi:gfo/Idh/MocA family oxidoreductase [Xylanimonas oleitrophica]|uniref:Gfo/Idh/MocA family oxidoreductase n=1 Tax=Xylanimonas oleitrophica TaxID=2607479 RepID=A0A2W5WMA5_9MICO|nr:Gfo/Idh/MocA family oxidoreductase [Xylanimonas oleitrophica]PZR52132.1 gfo/Idh/MocA family oxidoreductase [Xylanimonas oleitrophica]